MGGGSWNISDPEASSHSQGNLETQPWDKLTPGIPPFRCLTVSAGTVISTPHSLFLDEKSIATCLLSLLPLKGTQRNSSLTCAF